MFSMVQGYLAVETFEMRKAVLTLSLGKPK
jgi:hypothetical protein